MGEQKAKPGLIFPLSVVARTQACEGVVSSSQTAEASENGALNHRNLHYGDFAKSPCVCVSVYTVLVGCV